MNKENKKKRKTNDKNIHTAERKLSVGSVHEESYKRELERFFRHNLPKYRSKWFGNFFLTGVQFAVELKAVRNILILFV